MEKSKYIKEFLSEGEIIVKSAKANMILNRIEASKKKIQTVNKNKIGILYVTNQALTLIGESNNFMGIELSTKLDYIKESGKITIKENCICIDFNNKSSFKVKYYILEDNNDLIEYIKMYFNVKKEI